ncbi:MAG: T9SS type A sorting domain-containing protein [Bacteroidota bacterium]
MKKIFTAILIFVLGTSMMYAQEILTGLSENPVIKSHPDRPVQMKSSKLVVPVPVELPFFDDFNQEAIYPDSALWMDNDVFINTDFPVLPPTWGAATFDAINATGNIHANANTLQFFADQLRSKPIRLDSIFDPQPRALSPADSVYLSFYYQPQGRGNDPQAQDSLVLEFGWYSGDTIFSHVDSIRILVGDYYNVDTIFPGDTLLSPCDPEWGTRILDTLYPNSIVTLPCDSIYIPQTNWQHMWSSEGMTLDTFRLPPDTNYFRQVFIPVKDSIWFRSDFQFRFYNYASIASDNLQSWQSNCDYWNLDFVLLDQGRSRLDSTHQVIAFSGRAPSFLRDFQCMPFRQYRIDPNSAMKSFFDMHVANLDNGNQTVDYSYEVYNDLGNEEFSYFGGSKDLAPYNQSGFWNFSSEVEDFYTPYGDRDSISFKINHYLSGDPVLGLADTLSRVQKLFNFYAYDDGTPEFGYGLTPAGAQLAYQFALNARDTLRAVNMYFNKTLTGANKQFFNLAVWNDLNGEPGELIYLQEREKPVFEDSLYRFHTYHLDSALPLNKGNFYVGWIQATNHNMNVGFDSYNDASAHIFYNTTGEWQKSSYEGALMIRPVLGQKIKEDPVLKNAAADLFRIVPNPSRDGMVKLRFMSYIDHSFYPEYTVIKEEVLQQMEVGVFNLMGQAVYTGRYQPELNLSHLNKGIYIIRVIDRRNNQSMSQKLLITQ